MMPSTDTLNSAAPALSWSDGPIWTGRPSTRLYVLPELMMSPLLRLVRAHSPSLSAVVSIGTVSPACARASAGVPRMTSVHSAPSVLPIVVMAPLYPRGVDAESLHATIEIRPVSLQPSRCIGDVSARFSQRSRDHSTLEAIQFVGQRSRSTDERRSLSRDSFLWATGCRRRSFILVAIDDEDIFDELSRD